MSSCSLPPAFDIRLQSPTDTGTGCLPLFRRLHTQVVLLGFTSLAAPPGVEDGVEALAGLQTDYLGLLLPAFVHFLAHTSVALAANSETAASAALLRTLISQALLSIARAAPLPFKEKVSRRPTFWKMGHEEGSPTHFFETV